MKVREKFIITSIVILSSIAVISIIWKPVLWSLIFFGPLIILGFSDIIQKKQAIKNNFPVLGHGRYLLEKIRPEIMQYFVETDTEGAPINRMFRTLIYRRAKKDNFAHNTGEGAISPYHLEHGGDLIWQIGTGYFGCRTKDGKFCVDTYEKKATLDNVKMIEIKISQGAKPGHGGILPASKNTEEIAKIRDVEPHTDVHSPPVHSAFSSPSELMEFIKILREKSRGKPIGFKLCIGKKQEFIDLCKAMISTGVKPDFITVDGGEGGTGAAPVEFSNSLGMPLREGLVFVSNTLIWFNIKKDIKIIASGKVLTGFHIARVIALGADMVNSARAMMMAVGCIQALECNNNTCPVGVATQNKSLMKGLDVDDKSQRVANFHHETLHSFSELIAASGIVKPSDLEQKHINRRVSMNSVLKYDEIYPYKEK